MPERRDGPKEVAGDAPARDALGVNTRAVHGSTPAEHGLMSPPIVMSSTFAFASLAEQMAERDRGATSGFYQRLGHPTVQAAERRLADLEGAETALLFPSGMAALSAMFLGHVQAGDHVVALMQCYGGTIDVLNWAAERMGWACDFVDARAPETWEARFRPRTRILHIETPTNPTVCVVDIRRAADLAHRRGALLTVDNTFASPIGQQALALGADIVAYSATKSIGGHGDLLAGVALGAMRVLDPLYRARSVFGAPVDPQTAWLIDRSLKTLPMRVERANANALGLARRLRTHPRVARVLYPGLEEHTGHALAAKQMRNGFGPVVAFEVRGDAQSAVRVNDALKLFRQAPSLGGVESLVSLPLHASHRHLSPEERASAGIADTLVRLAVGIEDEDDLWADLERALAQT